MDFALRPLAAALLFLGIPAHAATPYACSSWGHSVALRNDGTVFTWGSNADGQLGLGLTSNQPTPARIDGFRDVLALSAGASHVVALKRDGTVWAWGSNQAGKLGNGQSEGNSAKPVQVSGLAGVIAVAAGPNHTLALKSDGSVWAWGQNLNGELGGGQPSATVPFSAAPVQVAGLAGISAIYTNLDGRNLALAADGSAWVWGKRYVSSAGVTVTPVKDAALSGIKGLYPTLYGDYLVKQDGSLWYRGVQESDSAWRATSIKNIVQVASDASARYFLKNDGTVWRGAATGEPTSLEQVAGLAGITQLAGGQHHMLALKGDGSAWAWGSNEYGEIGDGSSVARSAPVAVRNVSAATALAVGADIGGNASYAIAVDGTVWSWGANGHGELGRNTSTDSSIPKAVPGLAGVAAISCSDQGYTLALKSDGSVWAWGRNEVGELGDGTTRHRDSPVQVAGLTGIRAVSAGASHAVAVGNDGSLWVWGYYYAANGGEFLSTQPAKVGALNDVVDAAAGDQNTYAVTKDGSVWAWGNNSHGELGDGSSVDRGAPAPIAGLSGVARVRSIEGTGIALKNDGSVWQWGAVTSGWKTDGTPLLALRKPAPLAGLANIAQLGVGYGGNYATARDGSVYRWYGEAEAPNLAAWISKPLSIEGGRVVKADGTLLSWGYNAYGQVGDGTLTNRYTSTALVLNETVSGPLDLIPETPNDIPYDKLPPFLMKVSASGRDTSVLVKYDAQAQGRTGNVYITALLKANSPLLAKQGFAALPPDTVVPAVLTRSGFKQMGAGVPTDPVYSGPLDAANNTFTMYDPADFDNTRDYGVFCVGYATDVATPSAKGQIRAAVSGKMEGVPQCPAVKINDTSTFTASGNERIEALTLDAAITPKTADQGSTVNVYAWAIAPDGRAWMKTGNDWAVLTEPRSPTFLTKLEGTVPVPIVQNLDLRSIPGTQVYVGYGTSDKDMQDNMRYGHVYTVR